jgi:CRISPR-associated exonuclease Cas4
MGLSMFAEDDLLPISALQHMLYCPRQCALIHLEQLWAENSLTVHGKHLHERADSGKNESRNGVRTVRSLPLRSLKWGLIGKADIVEFHADSIGERCFPVEYKRGKPKRHEADRVQLCAQALCLEEMLDIKVSAGALFYGKTRRRLDVAFDESLRSLTEQTVVQLHELITSRVTPPAFYEKAKCDRCSLINLCMPRAGSRSRKAGDYLDRTLIVVLGTGTVSD